MGKKRVQLPKEHQKVKVISIKGNRTSLFLPALPVTTEQKRNITFLVVYAVWVGRMKRLLREASRDGEIILLSSSQETVLVMEVTPLASSGVPGS